VLDELHVYRGVFGAHVHHILRRLMRLAALHGARPRFIAASATVGRAESSRPRFSMRRSCRRPLGGPLRWDATSCSSIR
jgi:ATP-dependent helicase YprA (DUF1998 family)